MLKLEHNENTRNVAITLNKKTRFFNKPLLIAFAIAISIHLFPLLTIKIAKLNIIYPDPLPPAAVVADPQTSELPEQEVTAEVPDHALVKRRFLEPILPTITLPEIRANPNPLSIEASPWTENSETALMELEVSTLLSSMNDIAPTITLPKIEVTPSGPLAMIHRVDRQHFDSTETITLPAENIEDIRITYDVLVENNSGQIIWFTHKKGHLTKKLIHDAENVLKELRFESRTSNLFTEGQVTLTFHLRKKLDH